VRIIPNHVCIVTHLFDEVAGVREDRVVETWRVEARGRGESEKRAGRREKGAVRGRASSRGNSS
jgi:hypothetical protein